MLTSMQTFLQASGLAVLAKGEPVMVPLLAASVIALTVILERCSFWRRLCPREQETRILHCMAAGDLEQAEQRAQGSRYPVTRVLHAGLTYRQCVPVIAMEAAIQAELRRVKASRPVLDTIITLAPLLGLLGTITGMISAFGIGADTGPGQPTAITGGVAEALIATATGLGMAVMTLRPSNDYRAKVDQHTEHMEEQATRLARFLGHRGAEACMCRARRRRRRPWASCR
jgi:biopolymer transport protein ExbB